MSSGRDVQGGHDRYEIISTIASGGMGSVFLARRLGVAGFRRLVALKRVKQVEGMEDLADRLADEARIAAHLAHPNIVAVYDFGQDEHGFFLAMEYVDGASLASVLARGVTPTRDVAAYIIAEIAQGADHAHHARDSDGRPLEIVHRDISPQNVLLSRTGDVKLTDFGIARAANKLSRTPPGMAPGKLDYMAPEQLVLAPLDARADVFALGVMLWELTLGRSAFADAITRKARDQPIPRPRAIDPSYPEELDRIVYTATAFDVAHRTSSAALLAAELEAYLAASGARITRGHVAALVGDSHDDDAATARTDLAPVRTLETPPPARAETRQPVHAIHVGARLGDYELTRRLGDGGMGVVYAAVDRKIGKQAAIKVLRPQFAADPQTVERFLDEARAVNKIAHPNIVDIFGFHTDDGEIYCVMELLAGNTLRELLVARGALPVDEVFAVLRPVASAIDAAHEANIVHCDLKPENIFVCEGPERRVKVLDFGIAHLHGEPGAADSVVPLGTPAFMAPEQCQGERSDPRIDVYAFGLVAYNALTNAMPFASAGAIAQIADHLHTPPVPPSQRGAPPALDVPVLRCLAKDPASRFASAGAALAAMEAAVRPPSRRRAWPIVAALAGFAVVAGVAFLIVRSSSGSRAVDAGTLPAEAAVANIETSAPVGEVAVPEAAVAAVVDAEVARADDARPINVPVMADAGSSLVDASKRPPRSDTALAPRRGFVVTLESASAFDDSNGIRAKLRSQQAAFAQCLQEEGIPDRFFLGFQVDPITGKPTGTSPQGWPEDWRTSPQGTRTRECLGTVMKRLSFGKADREHYSAHVVVNLRFQR